MNKENQLILELCKFLSPDKKKIEGILTHSLSWQYVLGQLLFNRAGGVAYYVLKRCELLDKLNREVRNNLRASFEDGIRKTESAQKALDEISKIFKPMKSSYALLKGAYLMFFYPDGLRTSNDIDILISEKDIGTIETILKDSGFTQGNIRNDYFTPATRKEIVSSRMNRGETVPFVKETNLLGMKYIEIDINFSLDFKAKQDTGVIVDFLNSAKPNIKTRFYDLYTLSEVEFLIHLCCHLYKEASVLAWVKMGRDISLYKFIDLYLLINTWKSDIFYRELIKKIKTYSLERECYYALLRTKELFEIDYDAFDRLLLQIEPKQKEYLNEVFDPLEKKTYRFEMPYKEWVFANDRIGKLILSKEANKNV